MYIRFVFFIHYYVCFHAQDTGDISVKANVQGIISNKINVEDIYYYDDTTTDKSQNYTQRIYENSTGTINITHNNGYYYIENTGNGSKGALLNNQLSINQAVLHFSVV